MTAPAEMTAAEVATHAITIATTKTEEAFIEAFTAYMREVFERETEPHKKIALFVHGMLEGHRQMCTALGRPRA